MSELCLPPEGVKTRLLRLVLQFAAASLLLFGVAGCGAGADTQYAQMRIVHASSRAGTVDVLSRNNGPGMGGVAYNLSFGTITTYFPASAYSYVLTSTDTHIILNEVRPNAASRHFTLLLHDTVQGVQSLALPDQDQPASGGHVLVRFVNELQGNATIDLYLVPLDKMGNRTAMAAAGLTAGHNSSYVEVSSGTYALYAMRAGAPLHETAPLFTVPTVNYPSGAVRTIVLLDRPSLQQPLSVLTLNDADLETFLPR